MTLIYEDKRLEDDAEISFSAVEIGDGLSVTVPQVDDGERPVFLADLSTNIELAEDEEIGDDTEESPLTRGRPFAGFALLELVDMWGREFDFGDWDAAKVARRTRKQIKDHQDRGMPGLPIDARAHDKGDAAGWIVKATETELHDSKGTAVPGVELIADWTELGVELISKKILANFSPTIDMEQECIIGGSLTNWPASVDNRGVPLFDAIELSRSRAKETPTSQGESIMLEMTQEELDARVEEQVQAAISEFQASQPEPEPTSEEGTVSLAELASAFGLNTETAEAAGVEHLDKLAELVDAQANLRWKKKLAEMTRERGFAELATRVTGGTPSAPRGIPGDPDRIKSELMKLEPESAKFWSELMETVVKHGLTEFAEVGKDGKGDVKRELPKEYARDLDSGELTIADLRAPMIEADLGNLDQYDLSKWQ